MDVTKAIEKMEVVEEGVDMNEEDGVETVEEIGYYYRLGNNWTVPRCLIQETPSVKRGLSVAEEAAARRRGIRFVTYLVRSLAVLGEDGRTPPGTPSRVVETPKLDIKPPETPSEDGEILELDMKQLEKLLQDVEIPKLFAVSVHMFHRFYMVHPVQIFNEFVTAVACVFLAGKVIDKRYTLAGFIQTVHINAATCDWVHVPKELSFTNRNWAVLWRNEIVDLESIVVTTLCPIGLFFTTVFETIIVVIKRLIYTKSGLSADEAIEIRDKAFEVANKIYKSGCHLVVTEKRSVVAVLCVFMAYGDKSIKDWKGRGIAGDYWFNWIDKSLTLEKLQSMCTFFQTNLKEYHDSKGVTDSSQKPLVDDV